MKGRIPDPSGTPYCEGSQLDFVARRVLQEWPPSELPKYVMSKSVLFVQLRSFAIRSIRPLPGSMLISTLMRSPAPGATICGFDHGENTASRLAEVRRIWARPATMSVYATTRRL